MASANDLAPHDLLGSFEQLSNFLNKDSDLVRRGAYFSANIKVGLGNVPFYLNVASGQIARMERGPVLMRPWDFSVQADLGTWAKFWELVPVPGFHDLFALTKAGKMTIEGNIQLVMANLEYLKDLLALPRSILPSE